MRLLINKEIKRMLLAIGMIMGGFLLLSQLVIRLAYHEFSLPVFLLFFAAAVGVLAVCLGYFNRQDKIMEHAVGEIQSYLAGDTNARIECEEEGELYRLFHSVNTLAAVLNAHAEHELQAKEFLKNTISDISHQLKTPLAALNIYNGLLQAEAEKSPEIREFAALSEQELDRIDSLVQNLLKITRLDAKTLVFEKTEESVADMMRDVELHFAYRARQEQKELILEGRDSVMLTCDRDWMIEAVGNLVKNAFDHTGAGNRILIRWGQDAGFLWIEVADNGCGIHPEDVHHIFKRFYRSRFSQDTKGIGLGLPLTKAITEAHGGNLSVDSVWGQGSTFRIGFYHPTKL